MPISVLRVFGDRNAAVKRSAVVIDFPPPPQPDASAATLALASVVLTRKSTPKAVARCRKRVTRALERLAVTPSLRGMPDPADAARAVRKACSACGKCAGPGI